MIDARRRRGWLSGLFDFSGEARVMYRISWRRSAKHAAGVLLAFQAFLGGCGQSGPDSVKINSSAISSMSERITILERYVNFRRSYESLDFDLIYHNNSGGLVPGPSDWDIRLVTRVPRSELPTWVISGSTVTTPDRDWLKSVPTRSDLSGLNEWYQEGGCIVGLDRAQHIVAYRSRSL